MKAKDVSPMVIRRLPRYYRYLGELLGKNVARISSKDLSILMGVTASQIRQDLNCFGGFGQQGYGYNVEQLHSQIANILGLDKGYKTIIVGAGNLGKALAKHSNFRKRGFNIIGIFDADENLVGKEISGMTVQHSSDMDAFVRENSPHIAILALPKSAVEKEAHRLVELGVKGIWNFSYGELHLPEGVAVENVHLSDSLMTLSYKISQLEDMEEE